MVHPNYILCMKNVTLFTVTKDYVLFCEIDPTVDVYNVQEVPFMFHAQPFLVKRLVILPVWSFHQMAEELGDPKMPVGMMLMSLRCGSTLLCQIMARVPNVRVISEPRAMACIHCIPRYLRHFSQFFKTKIFHFLLLFHDILFFLNK